MFSRLFVSIAVFLPMAMAANVKIVEEIAAKVNGDIITRGELELRRKDIENFLKTQGLSGPKLADAVKEQEQDVLRDQIDTLLLVQKGKDLNINVDSEVTRYLSEIQVQSKITDPDKFHEFIREQSGMPYEDFRDQKKKEFLARRVVGQEVMSRINVPEAELRKYYDEHKAEFVRKEEVFLSQIVISTEGKSPEQVAAAEKKAKDLVARARKGEKFSDLARDNSDDAETAKNGGYIGPSPRGQMRKEIEDLVFKANKGDVTDPIQLPGMLLILKVEDRHEAGQASFEEVRNEVLDRMMQPRSEPKVREYLTKLRAEAFLEIKDGYVDSGAAPGKDTRWRDVAELKPQTTTKEEVAARRRKRFLGIIPYGHAETPKPEAGAAPVVPEGRQTLAPGASSQPPESRTPAPVTTPAPQAPAAPESPAPPKQ
jgi:parvulin-like peptidyl-prolyl isomerase